MCVLIPATPDFCLSKHYKRVIREVGLHASCGGSWPSAEEEATEVRPVQEEEMQNTPTASSALLVVRDHVMPLG